MIQRIKSSIWKRQIYPNQKKQTESNPILMMQFNQTRLDQIWNKEGLPTDVFLTVKGKLIWFFELKTLTTGKLTALNRKLQNSIPDAWKVMLLRSHLCKALWVWVGMTMLQLNPNITKYLWMHGSFNAGDSPSASHISSSYSSRNVWPMDL